jgi:hypothetical protein
MSEKEIFDSPKVLHEVSLDNSLELRCAYAIIIKKNLLNVETDNQIITRFQLSDRRRPQF